MTVVIVTVVTVAVVRVVIVTSFSKNNLTPQQLMRYSFAELQIQILPLIENLEWPYIWGVVRLLFVVCTPSSVGWSVGRLVGRSGDLRI